jgi:hypothetical protein
LGIVGCFRPAALDGARGELQKVAGFVSMPFATISIKRRIDSDWMYQPGALTHCKEFEKR